MEWLWLVAGSSLLITVTLVVVMSRRLVPRQIAPPELERRKFQLEVVKACAEVLGGAFFLVTLVLGWLQIQSIQEQLEVDRQGQITERFTRAIDQLGNEEITTRVGGIYALETIANDSSQHRQVVMEVLASFLRQRAHSNPEAASRDWEAARGLQPPADIEAAALVIGRRNSEGEPTSGAPCSRLSNADSVCKLSLVRVDLSGIDLNGADFSQMDLRGAVFNYSNIPHGSLRNSDMQSTDLRGANLRQADVTDASMLNTYLDGANMSGVKGLTCNQLSNSHGDGAGAANVDLECP